MMMTAFGVSSQPFLCTTASEALWVWRKTRYELFLVSHELENTKSFPAEAVAKMHSLGSCVRAVNGKWPLTSFKDVTLTFSFATDRPLTLALTEFEGPGVGHQVWDAAIALALYQRSSEAHPLPPCPRVLEVGAGVGLPGLDFARRRVASQGSVTLTDARTQLLSLLRYNVEQQQFRHRQHPEDDMLAAVQVAELDWNTHPSDAPAAISGQFDLVLGSDICWNMSDVPPLAKLVQNLIPAAKLMIIIGPAMRDALDSLKITLSSMDGVTIEEQRLALLANDADHAIDQGRERSGAIYRMLIVRPSI
eukprot:gnl/MRDRNA2_/MRDRNA2_160305_c0_seq1.p1 gnl/MRDRNA2_/MRDRNA2_160305_c0~~gnl/MRDRNA2_/MRDRNA2_160305_c0_seq1.p1  ORF type:complete len:306 (+),score=35.28 gnl/MRDRNA2_/MRDRNA2_160305_c0_seq1:111-1028(+)